MEDKIVDLSRFVQIEQIDKGSYGTVFLIEDKETKEQFAAKILNAPIDSNSNDAIIFLSREVNYNSGMNHPSVLKFIGYSPCNFDGNPNPVIITEYCKNRSLSIFIKNPEQYADIWNDTKKLITIFGIASGMKYLHENNIIHRDLKPANILMDDHLCPKIADFGFSKKVDSNGNFLSLIESTKIAKGTPIYMAPEVFLTDKSTKSSDVYAFGILLYEIVTNLTPFADIDNQIVLAMKVSNGKRPEFKTPINESYRRLIESCWSQNPEDRPTFDDIVRELIENKNFITKNVIEKDYRLYVKFITEYQSSFDNFKIIKLEDYIHSSSKTFQSFDIRRYNEKQNKTLMSLFLTKIGLMQEQLYPIDDFNKLDEECKQLVIDSENDPEKQYYIGTCLIESKNKFPLNINIGVKFLEKSISGGNVEAVLYLSKMLINDKNYMKAKTYLSTKYGKDDRIYYPYGIALKKLNKIKEAIKSFEEGSTKHIIECMYEYAKILFCGRSVKKDVLKAIDLFKESSKGGFHKSELFLKHFDKMNDNFPFRMLDSENQYFFVKKIIKNKQNDQGDQDDDENSFKFIKIKYDETESHFNQKSFECIDFIQILKLFQIVEIEILYPSKLYESILNQIANIKQKDVSQIEICVCISNIKEVQSYFDPDKIINVVDIKSGVQVIQKNAFDGCKSLKRIIIPSSVTTINEYSFYRCSSLEQIDIPSSVTSIGPHSFEYCGLLKKVSIPSSVTSIESFVFSECISLTDIIIPPSVTSIKSSAFYLNESLTHIKIPPSVISIGNNVFDSCFSLIDITIPSSITKIGACLFRNCTALTHIEIHSSVTEIGWGAFENCKLIEQFTIPSSITYIGLNTFKDCSMLKDIEIPPYVTKIGDGSFSSCTSLTQIIIPSSVSEIGQYSFNKCESLVKIEIPYTVTSIGEYSFSECSSLIQIKIPSFVTTIEDYVFNGCSSLTQIEIPSSVTSIGSFAFAECTSLTQIKIPSSVTSIGSYAFAKCTSLTQIDIPQSVKLIGRGAFTGCTSLTQMIIPSSITSIKRYVFDGCSSLKQVSFQRPISLTSFGSYAFANCTSLTQMEIPFPVKLIKLGAFDGCTSLKQIIIPSSVEKSQYGAFRNCPLLDTILFTDAGNSNYILLENIYLISKSSKEQFDTLLYVKPSIETANIPEQVKKIGHFAFFSMLSLKKVIIPPSVITIGFKAFKKCTALVEIIIPPSVTTIESFAFSECSSLTIVKIPSSVSLIQDHTFSKCSSLAQIEIPSSITSIGEGVFSECSSLAQIKIPSSITSIGEGAFSGCSSLAQIEIPYSITSIGEGAFSGCSSLAQIEIPSSITSIGEGTFSGCSSLAQIEIPSSIKSIRRDAFSGCSSLMRVRVPFYTYIEKDAFPSHARIIKLEKKFFFH